MTQSFSIIFGLTADPIHKGHEQAILNGVEYLRENSFGVKKLLLIPVFQPNLIANKKTPVASFEQRVKMCELVANRLSRQLKCDIKVSQIEKEIAQSFGKNNYSVDTIRQLNIKNCLFMVSADHFSGRWPKFKQWHKWREFLQFSGLLINQRPGAVVNQSFIDELKQMNPDVFIIENHTQIAVSSSDVRNKTKETSMLSEDVLKIIKQQSLYM